eukprot:scaffold492_cov257-Pinguiococcus_pyrenoidosus.AAC.49
MPAPLPEPAPGLAPLPLRPRPPCASAPPRSWSGASRGVQQAPDYRRAGGSSSKVPARAILPSAASRVEPKRARSPSDFRVSASRPSKLSDAVELTQNKNFTSVICPDSLLSARHPSYCITVKNTV